MKVIYRIFFIFLLFGSINRLAGQTELSGEKLMDSLSLILKTAKDDTIKVNILNQLGEICDEEEILKYAEPALKLAEKLSHKRGMANAYINIGYDHNRNGNYQKALDCYLNALKFSEQIGDKYSTAVACNNIANVYTNKTDDAQALDWQKKCLKIQTEIGDKKGMSISLNNIAEIYVSFGDISKALELHHQSLKIKEEIGDKKAMARSFNNIAVIFNRQGEIQKALEWHQKSLKIEEQTGNKRNMANSYNNIANILIKLEDFERANELLHKALKLQDEIGYKQGLGYTYNNLAAVYLGQRDYKKALEYYHQSLKIREEIGDKNGIAYSLNNIASLYFKTKAYNEAESFGVRALKTAKEIGFPENIRDASELLYKIYKTTGEQKLAFENFQLHVQMRDSINNLETKKASIRSLFKYTYEKKAAQDSVSHAKETEIKNAELDRQRSEIKAKRNQQYATFGGLALVILFAGVMYSRFKITQNQKIIIEMKEQETQRQNLIITEQKLLVEEKQKEILDSIHYAKRIQTALLSNEKYIDKSLRQLNRN